VAPPRAKASDIPTLFSKEASPGGRRANLRIGKACGQSRLAEGSRRKDLQMARRLKASPVARKSKVSITRGVRCYYDQTSSSAQQTAAFSQKLDRVSHVFDYVIDNDGVERLRLQANSA